MRTFKKKIVVEALRASPVLVVSEDGKRVSRKVPLAIPTLLDDDDDDGEIAHDPRTDRPLVRPIPLIGNDQKAIPLGLTKNMMKPTGFEPMATEGPIPPAEAAEDLEMYDKDKPLVERLEIAIQRFKQSRRMHQRWALIFHKFLKFGGVETGPRMFGSLSKEEIATMTAEEIARAKATHNIPWDRTENEDEWAVDFSGVCKAFM